MKTLVKAQDTTVATELHAVQGQIEFLQERETELKTALLENMQTQGVTFVKLEDGTTYTRSHRETLKAKDEEKARVWAEENNCLKLDTTKAMKILRRELKMPKFFTRVIGDDYLTVKHGHEDEE